MTKQGVAERVARATKADADLSQEQEEILRMITEDFLTTAQVAIARQTTESAVRKTISKLRKKGLIAGGLRKGLRNSTPLRAATVIKAGMIRLHGQQWKASFIYRSPKYDRIRQKGNVQIVDGNTVELNENNIEVYGATDDAPNSSIGFFAESVERATALSWDYWNRFFVRLESELGVVLIKPRTNNRELVHQGHYAEVGNALAKDYNERKVKLHVYAGDDGKLRFLIDNSFNLHELEAVRSHSSREDMKRVRAYEQEFTSDERVSAAFNEIADGALLPSEVLRIIREQAVNVKEIGAALNVLIRISTPQSAEEKVEPETPKVRPDYVG